MSELFYLYVAFFIIIMVYVLYPWIHARIQLYLLRLSRSSTKDPLGSGSSTKDPLGSGSSTKDPLHIDL